MTVLRKRDQSAPELYPVLVVSPWHHIGIDFISPISPASHQGNRYIQIYFTKFVEAIAMENKYATNVALALFKVHATYVCTSVDGCIHEMIVM